MLGQNSWLPFGALETSCYFTIARRVGSPLELDYCTMKKIIGFYVQVLVNVDLLSYLLQQLLVERPSCTFVANMEYEQLSSFSSFYKMIGHTSSTSRHYLKVTGRINK